MNTSTENIVTQGSESENYLLPCKPGDTVWCIKKLNNQEAFVKKSIVHMVGFTTDGIVITLKGDLLLINRHYIWNKTVFATETEAEDALKARKEKSQTLFKEFFEKLKSDLNS